MRERRREESNAEANTKYETATDLVLQDISDEDSEFSNTENETCARNSSAPDKIYGDAIPIVETQSDGRPRSHLHWPFAKGSVASVTMPLPLRPAASQENDSSRYIDKPNWKRRLSHSFYLMGKFIKSK